MLTAWVTGKLSEKAAKFVLSALPYLLSGLVVAGLWWYMSSLHGELLEQTQRADKAERLHSGLLADLDLASQGAKRQLKQREDLANERQQAIDDLHRVSGTNRKLVDRLTGQVAYQERQVKVRVPDYIAISCGVRDVPNTKPGAVAAGAVAGGEDPRNADVRNVFEVDPEKFAAQYNRWRNQVNLLDGVEGQIKVLKND